MIGKRIIIIGSSNSGKSTLGQQLASYLGAPFIELDALHWQPNWTGAEPAVFRERVSRAIGAESWVVAGNYLSDQQDVSWPEADTVIWLDLPLPTVLCRCIVRSWQRWRSQELLWGTNKENFWEHLMIWNPNRSLLGYTIRHHRSRRRTYEALSHDPRWSHIRFIRLRAVYEIEALVTQISEPDAS